MRLTIGRAAALTGALVVLSGLALAQTADAPRAKGKGGLAVCRADVATHCQGIDAGGGKRIRCLADNRAKLSPDCAAVVDARLAAKGKGAAGEPVGDPAGKQAPGPGQPAPQGQFAPGSQPGPGSQTAAGTDKPLPPIRLRKSCAVDLATHCQSVERGRAKQIACLAQVRDKLSPECSVAIDAAIARRRDMRRACAGDRNALCANRKGPEAMSCLRASADRLSPACARYVAAMPERKRGKQ